ncbi:MAG TPA: glycosyltransferase family 39 protein [Streptosporangiaceae bacterium]|nr:glycosyltransferase family 39 protein [Streptosporangiaceae bacterium]
MPTVIAFALGRWQVSARSFSAVEAATLAASHRPLSALLPTLTHVDAVHGAYYLLIHEVLFFGTSETVVRLPTVVATAVAAGMLATLGARLAGPWVGLAAGMLYAVLPPVTLAAQTARPFAVATALAIVACHRFVVYARDGGRRNAAWYALALTATGWCDVMAALVVAANVVTLVWAPPNWPGWRREFMVTVAAVGLAVSPVAALALSQVGQTQWEQPLSSFQAAGVAGLIVACGLLVAVTVCPGTREAAAAGPRALAVVAGPWLVLPPAVLLAVSVISPLWQDRYLLFCLPALCLVVVAAAARLPARAYATVLPVAVGAALAAQPLVRQATGTDDLRAVSRTLATHAQPGDAVIFHNPGGRLLKAAYPDGFTHLRDIALRREPVRHEPLFGFRPSALYGQDVNRAELARRLAQTTRLWVIRLPRPGPPRWFGVTETTDFCALRTWRLPSETLTLYHRCLMGQAPQVQLGARPRTIPGTSGPVTTGPDVPRVGLGVRLMSGRRG